MDIDQIIKAASGPTKLARALGLAHVTVLRWTRVPVHHAAAVATITGIPRHQLRPDVWDPPAPETSVAA